VADGVANGLRVSDVVKEAGNDNKGIALVIPRKDTNIPRKVINGAFLKAEEAVL
jgi:hypothetical protein